MHHPKEIGVEEKELSLPVSLPFVREISGLPSHPNCEHSSQATWHSDDTHPPQKQGLRQGLE